MAQNIEYIYLIISVYWFRQFTLLDFSYRLNGTACLTDLQQRQTGLCCLDKSLAWMLILGIVVNSFSHGRIEVSLVS